MRRPSLLLLIPLFAVAWASSCSTGNYQQSEPFATSSSTPIAFVRGKNWRELVTIKPDGSSRRLVTRVRRGRILGLAWSPSGRKIAFQVDAAEHETLYVINANGTGLRRLARWRDTYGADPAWSPRGRKIAFDKHDDGVHEIWTINADGSGARRLTPPGSWRFPSWSPDGTRIAMGGGGIWVMKANGRDRRRVIRADLEGSAPVWTPANKIAFYVGDDLWIANRDGSGRRIAIKDGQESYEPGGIEFSPDGRKVAFQAFFSVGNSEIIVGDVLGGAVQRLTDNNLGDFGPSWSPDGKALAFGRYRPGGPNANDGPGDVYVMNADGTEVRNLTNSAADESLRAWAPKG